MAVSSFFSNLFSSAMIFGLPCIPSLLRNAFPLIPLAAHHATRSEERRVGKECRSRCDWSSDVCSSDLFQQLVQFGDDLRIALHPKSPAKRFPFDTARGAPRNQIGRASCRERV